MRSIQKHITPYRGLSACMAVLVLIGAAAGLACGEGEGCLYILVFRALRPFGHFSVMSPITPFESMSPVEHRHQKWR
jgi:hypothetical protein